MIFLVGLEVHERQKGGPLFPHPKAAGVGYSPAFGEIQETRWKIVAHNLGEGFILVAATEGASTPTVAYRHTGCTRAHDYSSVYAVRSVWFHHEKEPHPCGSTVERSRTRVVPLERSHTRGREQNP